MRRSLQIGVAAIATVFTLPLASQTLVADLRPGSESSRPTSLVDLSGTLFFLTGTTLYMSDGTAAGTRPVPGAPPCGVLIAAAHHVLFGGWTENEGWEPWRTDGTAIGTRLLRDVRPGPASSNPRQLVAAGRKVFFTADDGVHGEELWMNEVNEVRLVVDLAPGSASGDYTWQTPVKGELFFVSTSYLYKTSGASAARVTAVRSKPTQLCAFGDRLAVIASEVYTTDGSDARRVPGPFRPHWLTAAGNTLFIAGKHADLTISGYHVFAEESGGPTRWLSEGLDLQSIHYQRAAADGETVYFVATDTEHGAELWKASSLGVRMVRDLTPGPAGTAIMQLKRANSGGIVFIADVAGHGQEIWRSRSAGTSLLAEVIEGPESSNPFHLTFSRGHLFFSARHPQYGTELWRAVVGPVSTPIGVGFGPAHRTTALRSTDPALGSTMRFSLERGPANSSAVLLVGLPAEHPLFWGELPLYFDPRLVVTLGPFGLIDGTLDVDVAVPDDPNLIGGLIVVQAVASSTETTLGIETSNGLLLRLDR